MSYPSKIIRKTENYFNDLKLKNDNVKMTRTMEVYNKVPQIKEMDNKILKLGTSFAKKALNSDNPEKEVETFKKEINKLNTKKTELLVGASFDITYLDDVFSCDICKDTGYNNGKYCKCFTDKMKEFLYADSNLPLIMDNRSFDDFNLDFYEDDGTDFSPKNVMASIFEFCKIYAMNFSGNDSNLLMFGGTGLGKTFLSSCIAKTVIDSGYSVYYQSAYRMFNVFEENKFSQNPDEALKVLIKDIYNSDLLIIDDLGTEMVTSYTSEILFDLINTRINSKKPIIINTNLGFDELENLYSARISSRLIGAFQPLKFTGSDIRLKEF